MQWSRGWGTAAWTGRGCRRWASAVPPSRGRGGWFVAVAETATQMTLCLQNGYFYQSILPNFKYRITGITRREDPRLGQRLVLVEHAGRLEPLLLLVRYLGQLGQVQDVCPQPVDVLLEWHVLLQQLPGVVL